MKKSASEQLQGKWSDLREKKYSLRSVASNDLKIPKKPTRLQKDKTPSLKNLQNLPVIPLPDQGPPTPTRPHRIPGQKTTI